MSRVLAVMSLLLGVIGPSLAAQQPATCDSLRSQLIEAIDSPDSVVVYVRLRAEHSGTPLPRWYLQAALTEVVMRFEPLGVRYDPLLDVALPVKVTTSRGAWATAFLGARETVVTSLGPAPHALVGTLTGRVSGASVAGRQVLPPSPNEAAIMMDSALMVRQMMDRIEKEHKGDLPSRLYAEPSSVLTHLASAVAAAQRDSAFPPPPEGAGDSISLMLEVRPGVALRRPSDDSNAATLPLFHTAGLHASRARHAFYDGEVDVAAREQRRNRMPRWPAEEEGTSGGVLMAVLVDSNGQVDPAQLTVLEGTRGFRDAVVEAARKWRYTPATVSGCSVPSLVGEAVLFRH